MCQIQKKKYLMGSLMITSNIVPYIPKAKDLWVLRHFIINIELLVL